MIVVNGITWDHPRGYDPLVYASQKYSEQHKDIRIVWKKRTLEEFGDYPISKLADTYDLIMVDHPFSGEAYAKNIFLDLHQYYSSSDIRERETQSVGLSFESYNYKGALLAIACDAAAVVSSYLPDKVHAHDLPSSWEDYMYFSKHNITAVPLCPVDIWCVFLSICAQLSNKNFFDLNGLNIEVAEQAIERIYDIIRVSKQESWNLNPIQLLDMMSEHGEIVYSPFLFGYSNYSRKSYNRKFIVKFSNVMSVNYTITSLLGGVGIAVSTKTSHPEVCADFTKFVTAPTFQQREYYQYNGQPAYLTAWKNTENNLDSNDFFLNTLDTLSNAYMRPRYERFNVFQESVSKTLHTSMYESTSSSVIAKKINDEFYRIVLQ